MSEPKHIEKNLHRFIDAISRMTKNGEEGYNAATDEGLGEVQDWIIDCARYHAEKDLPLREIGKVYKEIEAAAKSTGCYVAVREGGGPEDLCASLAVSIAKLRQQQDVMLSVVAELRRDPSLATLMGRVFAKFLNVTATHGHYASLHEGYGVILEELDELWDEIKKPRERRDLSRVEAEALDLAVAALKLYVVT